MRKIQMPRLGNSLHILGFSKPQDFCPFCGLKIEAGPYHEYDEYAHAWRCKSILEPR